MPRRFVLLPIILVLVAVPLSRAAEKTGEKSQEAEVRQVIAALEDNFNRADAKSLAACWTSDGEFVGPRGDRIVGRETIEAAFRVFLAKHPNVKLRLNVASWRLVAGDVALVDLVGEMTPVPQGLEAEPASSLVLVKRDGRWLIGSMHETLGSDPSHHVRLKGLNWLVGDWAEQDAAKSGVVVRSTYDWTANGSYLLRKFTAQGKSGASVAGTEVIGWDPRAHRIRSWTFDSDGGFGESAWTRDGDRRVIRYSGILANGDDVSATHVLTPVDANTVTLQSKDRLINGQKQPDLPEITIKRSLAQDESKAKPGEPANPPRQVLP